MKKIIFKSIIAGVLLSFAACDKKFDDLNTNQTSPTAIDPAFELNQAIINASYTTGTVIYETSIVQQMVTPNSGVLTGANYNQDNRLSTDDNWVQYYRNVIRNTKDIIRLLKDKPERSNLLQMTRIFQAFTFMVLTDSYGDIPYFEGGGGYGDQIFFPKYDAQEAIYDDIIKELTEASAALDASKPIETSDVFYSGNIVLWKKFGYSLLLRAGMHLSEVNATKAQQTVAAAFAGGVITNNAENAVVRHDPNFQSPIGGMLNSTEAANWYLAAPFVDHLKANNDPRLSAIAIRYKGAKSGPEQTPAIGTTAPADQIGMPMGYDNGTIAPVAAALGLASFYDFSQVDRRRLVKVNSPIFLVTAAQNNLLLAEAAQRTWITGDPAAYFEAGVRAHMLQMAAYDPLSAIPAADINTYIANHPYDPANALKQINTEYWIASFLNGPEAWANFRRSGYPTLTKNPYPGADISGNFINRLTYPNSEISVNKANMDEAISRQGADNLDTKVWWDK
ncbi:SusD/RagB family nutrient-binding outer membrane lipoprotein [Pollutibacter soli]|uniref:SusD/RagB family nutrient-binding outer membrane lipoprotein n=1 Tax=Pollutibacter soli TaxID=3034157 RepID=UPI003013717E